MFSRELRDAVADGAITVSIRLWARPQVKVGGRYATAGVVIEIDSIELMPFSAVTAEDVRCAVNVIGSPCAIVPRTPGHHRRDPRPPHRVPRRVVRST